MNEIQPLVSVIIPVYNRERTIKVCLESVMASCLKEIEILVIDDGSTDSTSKIVKEIAKKANYIKYFYKENSGVSAARNMGLKNAAGKWILFVDSDEAVSPYIFDIVNNKENIDLYVFEIGSLFVFNGKIKIPEQKNNICEIIKDKDNIIKNIFKNENRSCFVTNKFFKNSIIKNNHIFFDEQCALEEDRLFLNNYLCYIKYLYVSDVVCNFRLTWPGLSHLSSRKGNIENIDKNIRNFKKNIEALKKIMLVYYDMDFDSIGNINVLRGGVKIIYDYIIMYTIICVFIRCFLFPLNENNIFSKKFNYNYARKEISLLWDSFIKDKDCIKDKQLLNIYCLLKDNKKKELYFLCKKWYFQDFKNRLFRYFSKLTDFVYGRIKNVLLK